MKQNKRTAILYFALVVALLVIVGNMQYSDYRLDKALLQRLEIKQNSFSEHLDDENYKSTKKFVLNKRQLNNKIEIEYDSAKQSDCPLIHAPFVEAKVDASYFIEDKCLEAKPFIESEENF